MHNIWGLRPAVVEGTKDIAPLTAFRDLDSARLLDNVTTFNFHPHLPHYELTAPESDGLRVLGRQRVDPNRPHPFTAAGNTEFNALIWMPPAGPARGRHRADRLDALHHAVRRHRQPASLWHNLATMKYDRFDGAGDATKPSPFRRNRGCTAAKVGCGRRNRFNWPGRASTRALCGSTNRALDRGWLRSPWCSSQRSKSTALDRQVRRFPLHAPFPGLESRARRGP